jgi:hypothetical protein
VNSADSIRIGMQVKTCSELLSTDGMMINPKHLVTRTVDALGTIKGYVPGHGGDVWWVEHEDGSIAAYAFEEFEVADA